MTDTTNNDLGEGLEGPLGEAPSSNNNRDTRDIVVELGTIASLRDILRLALDHSSDDDRLNLSCSSTSSYCFFLELRTLQPLQGEGCRSLQPRETQCDRRKR